MAPVKQDQHQRFLRMFTSHEPAVRAFIRRMLPSRADADDVMQETAIVMWEKFGQFHEGGDFRAWAFGIARFKALSWLRDKRRDRLVLSEEAIELLAVETLRDEPRLASQRAALERCAEKLIPTQRQLLFAAYQPEARIQDIAVKSGRSVPGFYQWLHRTRQILLDCVRREMKQETSS